jgi:hypothetical protein
MMTTKETLIAWLKDERFSEDLRDDGFVMDADRPRYRCVRPPIMFGDGTTASLQFSQTHYCMGTDDAPVQFEMYHCPPHPMLDEFGGEDDPYAFVPIDVIVAYADTHGGIVPLNAQLAMMALEK